MGPPCEHGGRLNVPVRPGMAGLLQWGRRVNTAEGEATRPDPKPEKPLQWGRRVNTAEGLETVGLKAQITVLQWGRRVNTAEGTPRPAAPIVPAHGFNGAAV